MNEPMTDLSMRTDLAMEVREKYKNDNVEISGVIIDESTDKKNDITITKVSIVTENGARAMGKPKGIYITLEAPRMSDSDAAYDKEVSKKLSSVIKEMLPECKDKRPCILIAGLGNRMVTADSLGPNVVDRINISRHIEAEFGELALDENQLYLVCSIVPGVMAQTGMDTAEILQGIVKRIKPDYVIAIDALAARSSKRLNRTIQIADSGIHPGSGVGNHRCEISKESLGVPVLSIGVPTVVEAAAIVHDAQGDASIAPHLNGMYVTPKDIDEAVCKIAYIVSDALNLSFLKHYAKS